jgi:cytoskeletal protein RodZ
MFEIGATLREARERRQLTYEQVEAEIKVRAKYLRALEEEEFDSLPSGTYVRGFLRAYASYLGLDGRLFVDEYASRFGTRHDDELFRRRRERPMTQRRESSSAVLVALIAVVAIGVLFFVAWRFGPGEANTPPLSVVTETQTQTQTDRNANSGIPSTDTTTTTDHAPHGCHPEGRASARRRHDGHDLGQDHTPLDAQGDRPAAGRGRRPPGRRRAPG